jgi:Zn-finger nucleic acid-binding protein
MKCPADDTVLVMADRQGIEIDYCPTCRGVWLDRGELDKLIERAVAAEAGTRAAPRPEPVATYPYRDDDDDHRYRYGGKKKKKSSLLGEIFDF